MYVPLKHDKKISTKELSSSVAKEKIHWKPKAKLNLNYNKKITLTFPDQIQQKNFFPWLSRPALPGTFKKKKKKKKNS